jgi:ATP-dependent exoDNAse (exonuclease V) beta subunit
MNVIEMKDKLSKVERVFGKQYHDEIFELFWREFKYLHSRNFDDLVDQVLSCSRAIPTLSDFKKVNSEMRHNKYEEEKKQRVDEINTHWPQQKVSREKASSFFGELKKSMLGGTKFNSEDSLLEKYDCNICKDTGEIFAKHKEKLYIYLFICKCEMGKQFSGVRWHNKLLAEFVIV